jgi:hypothetical protein
MPPIVIQAALIVAERESLYNMVVADMYFIAVLRGDLEMAQQIWREAWDDFNGQLLALLVSTEMQINAMQGNEKEDVSNGGSPGFTEK